MACLQYFINYSQHTFLAQSVAAFINIRLPCQRCIAPVIHLSGTDNTTTRHTRPEQPSSPSTSSPSTWDPTSPSPSSSTSPIPLIPQTITTSQLTPTSNTTTSTTSSSTSPTPTTAGTYVSLRPYIRRLIITGRDSPSLLQALFGNNWAAGVGPLRHQERVNYLFTAKSGGWASTKAAYDILPDEHAPFLRPLRQPLEEEIRLAEARWSEWLAMEDWMIGPRSPW